MPLILKHGEVNKVESKAPPVDGYKWDNDLKKMVKPEAAPTPKVEKVIIKETKPETVEEQSHYHEVHDGELHRLFNTKSDYLTDMLDLKNNK